MIGPTTQKLRNSNFAAAGEREADGLGDTEYANRELREKLLDWTDGTRRQITRTVMQLMG